jgi:hypothetical protein
MPRYQSTIATAGLRFSSVLVRQRSEMLRWYTNGGCPIDDMRDPARAMHSDLEAALSDMLATRTVQVPETQPFGCATVR